MHLGFIFAMPEEASVLKVLNPNSPLKEDNYLSYPISTFNVKNNSCTAITCGIGKAAAAAGTLLLLERFKVDAIVNVGLAGGVNCEVGDIILGNQALYHDVDVTAFGYQKGQLPGMPLLLESKGNILDKAIKFIEKNPKIKTGVVATGDQFVNNLTLVENIKKLYSANTLAIEMEAAAIAQVCINYKKDFLFIKKISDLADQKASEDFTKQLTNFTNVELILQHILI